MRKDRLNQMMKIGMLGALGLLLMTVGQVYVPPFQSFLRYDPGDVPAMIATFSLGPMAGVAVQAIKSLLFFFTGQSTAGWVGVLANFLAGAALVVSAGAVQRLAERAGRSAWLWGPLSVVVGTLVMSAILIPVNYYITYPLFGMTGEAAWTGAWVWSTPFNLFKGAISCSISLAFYRRLQPFLAGKVAAKAA